MIRTSDGSVNFACVRLDLATYESPVNVAAGFEQMACRSGGPTRVGSTSRNPARASASAGRDIVFPHLICADARDFYFCLGG
jgi:hypothetical protein